MTSVFLIIRQLFPVMWLLCSFACIHQSTNQHQIAIKDGTSALIKKEINMVLVPENKSSPSHVVFHQIDRYAFGKNTHALTFTKDLPINPLMRNPTLVARVEKKGKVVREVVAKKSATSSLNDKRSTWSPVRTKLALMVPFLSSDEEVVVTTSYEWMDKRWLPPVFLQEDGPILESQLTVDVPYGITMHFKVAKNHSSFDYVPMSFPLEKPIWAQEGNRGGLGTRFLFKANEQDLVTSTLAADFYQVLLAFESPAQIDGNARFDTWEAVSSYLYNRIDRYEMPSNEIREFTIKETKDKESIPLKVARVFSFLRNEIEKRQSAGAYQEQIVQPATRTFARKFGSPFDIAILGKSMLLSIGVEADLVAVADRRYNPNIPDFFSPALFSTVILAVTIDNKPVYFDPDERVVSTDQLHPNLQGQHALLLRPKKGMYFSLPFDDAQKNTKTLSYQLWMTEDGWLEGEYAIDLTGFEASEINQLSEREKKSLSPEMLEAKLLGSSSNAFSIGTVIHEVPAEREFRIFGETKRRMLAKNEGGRFELPLDKIIEPALIALKSGANKGYSSVTKISLFMVVPKDFTASNLPKNVNVQLDGVSGRFSASFANGQLVIEGIGLVSLPTKDVSIASPNTLNQIKLFGEHKIDIGNQAIISGAPGGEQNLNETKDS